MRVRATWKRTLQWSAIATAITVLGAGAANAPASASAEAPVRTITGVHHPFLAVAPDGTMYVTNEYTSIDVYPPGATGNATPIRTITSPAFAGSIFGMDIGADGKLYIAAYPTSGGPYGGRILVMAPGASGASTPIQSIGGPTSFLDYPTDVKVVNGTIFASVAGAMPGIRVFDAAADGDAVPQRIVAGPKTLMDGSLRVAVANGLLYVANGNTNTVTVFPSSADGNVAPMRTLTAANGVSMPYGLAVDSNGVLRVANANTSTVTTYLPTANTPLDALAGSVTGMYGPQDLELVNGFLYVANGWPGSSVGDPQSSITVFQPGPPIAPIVESVTAGNASASVTLIPPASNGGAPVTGYRVTATPGGRSCVSTTRFCTVTGLTNGVAYRFIGYASNLYGTSPGSAQTAPVTPATTPSAPSALKAKSWLSNESKKARVITVAWTAPNNIGGAAIAKYEVRYAPKGTTTWSGWINNETRRVVALPGLRKAKAYVIQVRAVNRTGPGTTASVLVKAL